MGAEQSQQTKKEEQAPPQTFPPRRVQRTPTGTNAAFRGNSQDESPTTSEGTRPASPPLSICYDSDLPYVSYIDRPIGDSPKISQKNLSSARNFSSSGAVPRKPIVAKAKRPQSTSKHNIVVVKPGIKDQDFDIDADLSRLRNIPVFWPVMRGTLNSANSREPEILERLQSIHLQNICHRMQSHLNVCAAKVANEQSQIIALIKTVDNSVTTLFGRTVDMQKTYSSYAEQFGKIRSISQKLSRCNSLLNANIESLETLNNYLAVEDRLEPFIWRTEQSGNFGGRQ